MLKVCTAGGDELSLERRTSRLFITAGVDTCEVEVVGAS